MTFQPLIIVRSIIAYRRKHFTLFKLANKVVEMDGVTHCGPQDGPPRAGINPQKPAITSHTAELFIHLSLPWWPRDVPAARMRQSQGTGLSFSIMTHKAAHMARIHSEPGPSITLRSSISQPLQPPG